MATTLALEPHYPDFFKPGAQLDSFVETFPPDPNPEICPLYIDYNRVDIAPEVYAKYVFGFGDFQVPPALRSRIPKSKQYTIPSASALLNYAHSIGVSDANNLSQLQVNTYVDQQVDLTYALYLDQFSESGVSEDSQVYDWYYQRLRLNLDAAYAGGTISKKPFVGGGYTGPSTPSAQSSRFTAGDSHVRNPLGKRFIDPLFNLPDYYDGNNSMQFCRYYKNNRQNFMGTNAGTYQRSPGLVDDFYEWLNGLFIGLLNKGKFTAAQQATSSLGFFSWEVTGDSRDAFATSWEVQTTNPAGRALTPQRIPIAPPNQEMMGFIVGFFLDWAVMWDEGNKRIADVNTIDGYNPDYAPDDQAVTWFSAADPATPHTGINAFPFVNSNTRYKRPKGPKRNRDFFYLGYRKGKAMRKTYSQGQFSFVDYKLDGNAYVTAQVGGKEVLQAASGFRRIVMRFDDGASVRFVDFNPYGDSLGHTITAKRTDGSEYTFPVIDGLLNITAPIGTVTTTTTGNPTTPAPPASNDVPMAYDYDANTKSYAILAKVGSGTFTGLLEPLTGQPSPGPTPITMRIESNTVNGIVYDRICNYLPPFAGGAVEILPGQWRQTVANTGNTIKSVGTVMLQAQNSKGPVTTGSGSTPAPSPTNPQPTPPTGPRLAAPSRVMVLGNSITVIPAQPGTGWDVPGEGWGMAATERSKDYCSLLEADLRVKYPNILFGRANIADFESTGYKSGSYDYSARVGSPTLYYLNNQGADLLIISLSENVDPGTFNSAQYKTGLDNIINTATAGVAVAQRRVILRTCFWGTNTNPVNTAIQEYAAQHNYELVELADMRLNPAYTAQNDWPQANQFVQGHPGNDGHRPIADRFFAKIDPLYGTTSGGSGANYFTDKFCVGPVMFGLTESDPTKRAEIKRVLASAKSHGCNLATLVMEAADMPFTTWAVVDDIFQYTADLGFDIRIVMDLAPQLTWVGSAATDLMGALPSNVKRGKNWEGQETIGPANIIFLSMYDAVALKYYSDTTEIWINHLKTQPYYSHIKVCGFATNNTGEDAYDQDSETPGTGAYYSDVMGYDDAALAAYRNQMRNKFGSMQAFNTYCGTGYTGDFDTLQFPTPPNTNDVNSVFDGKLGSMFALHRCYGLLKFNNIMFGTLARLTPWTRLLDVGSYFDSTSVRRGTANPVLLTGNFIQARKANDSIYYPHKYSMTYARAGGLYSCNEVDFSSLNVRGGSFADKVRMIRDSRAVGTRLCTLNSYAISDADLNTLFSTNPDGTGTIGDFIAAGPLNPVAEASMTLSLDQWTHLYNDSQYGQWLGLANNETKFVDIEFETPVLTE